MNFIYELKTNQNLKIKQLMRLFDFLLNSSSNNFKLKNKLENK